LEVKIDFSAGGIGMAYFADEEPALRFERTPITQDQMQREFEYALAQQVLKAMLKKGLITDDEFCNITILNRKSFSPALAAVMSNNS